MSRKQIRIPTPESMDALVELGFFENKQEAIQVFEKLALPHTTCPRCNQHFYDTATMSAEANLANHRFAYQH